MKDTHFVDGNFEDKYNAKNPISKMLVNGFLTHFIDLVHMMPPRTKIIEVGAGDGQLTRKIADVFTDASIIACDLSDKQNEMARQTLASYGKRITVQKEDAENLTLSDKSVDAVFCCEVLEHVEKPEQAIAQLYRILQPGGYALVSVPWEPLWRVLNLARGKYIADLGNTPGHLNHFSRASFKKLATDAGFSILKEHHPFPWSMMLLQKNN